MTKSSQSHVVAVPITRRPFDPGRHCGAKRQSDDLPGARMSQGKLRLREGGGKGQPCRLPKGWGTDHLGFGHCRIHAGSTPNAERAAAREQATAALASLGVQIRSDPAQALLEQVWEAAGNVAFLRAGVQALGRTPVVAGQSHVFVRMYGEERDRLARICKLALDAGIAERAINAVEQFAEKIVSVVLVALDGLPPAEHERRRLLAVGKLSEFREFDVLAVGPGSPAGVG